MNTDTNTLNVGWDQKRKKTVLFQRKRLWFCETDMAGVTGHPPGALLSVTITTHIDVIMAHRQQLGNILSLVTLGIKAVHQWFVWGGD